MGHRDRHGVPAGAGRCSTIARGKHSPSEDVVLAGCTGLVTLLEKIGAWAIPSGLRLGCLRRHESSRRPGWGMATTTSSTGIEDIQSQTVRRRRLVVYETLDEGRSEREKAPTARPVSCSIAGMEGSLQCSKPLPQEGNSQLAHRRTVLRNVGGRGTRQFSVWETGTPKVG